MAAEEEEKSRLKQRSHNNSGYAGGKCTKAAACVDTRSASTSSLSVGTQLGKGFEWHCGREGEEAGGWLRFVDHHLVPPKPSSVARHPACEMKQAVKYHRRLFPFLIKGFSEAKILLIPSRSTVVPSAGALHGAWTKPPRLPSPSARGVFVVSGATSRVANTS